MSFHREKPWRSRAPFASHLAASRRRGSYGHAGLPLLEDSDLVDAQAHETTPPAEELAPVTTSLNTARASVGRIDVIGLLAFRQRTADAEHTGSGGWRPGSAMSGRRSA